MTVSQDWSLTRTKLIAFIDVPIGAQFAYAKRGSINASRNVFTKVEPYTASAPNAVSAASKKLKLWFEPGAVVRVQKPKPTHCVSCGGDLDSTGHCDCLFYG